MRKLHLLLDLIAFWWHRAITSRYVLELERQVRRLEAENAGLRDTVFGLRGLPPLPKGVAAHYETPAAAADPGPAIRPKVEPISRPGAQHKAQSREREIQKKVAEFNQAELARMRQELRDELQKERDRQAGKGYAVTEAGITQVQDPVVELPEEQVNG